MRLSWILFIIGVFFANLEMRTCSQSVYQLMLSDWSVLCVLNFGWKDTGKGQNKNEI